MTAWIDPDAMCVAVDAGAVDCEVAGAGGFASTGGTCLVGVCGSESVSMLSYLE